MSQWVMPFLLRAVRKLAALLEGGSDLRFPSASGQQCKADLSSACQHNLEKKRMCELKEEEEEAAENVLSSF